MWAVRPVVRLLRPLQRQQQAGFAAGAVALDIRRPQPVDRLGGGCSMLVREDCPLAQDNRPGMHVEVAHADERKCASLVCSRCSMLPYSSS